MPYYKVMRIPTILGGIWFLTLAVAADFPTVEPKDLVAQVQSKGAKPPIFHVGFPVLYRGKHIPFSVFAGPGSKTEGLDALKAAVAKLSRNQEVVIYCGCCPFDRCPNLRPAIALLKQMGFTNVKALNLPTNFAADWVDHGYPVDDGSAAR